MAYRKWSTNSEEILLLYHKEFFIQITLMVFRDEIDLMNSKTLSQFLLKWKKKKKKISVFPPQMNSIGFVILRPKQHCSELNFTNLGRLKCLG